MALKGNVQTNFGVDFADAYWQVARVISNKNVLTYNVNIFVNEAARHNGNDSVTSLYFEIPYVETKAALTAAYDDLHDRYPHLIDC